MSSNLRLLHASLRPGLVRSLGLSLFRSSSSSLVITSRPSPLALPSMRHFASEDDFSKHVQLATRLASDPENDDKLKLYALFKQSTQGPNSKAKPGALDFVGKYKWQAWTELGQMSKEDAQKAYVIKVQQLIKTIGLSQSASTAGQQEATGGDALVISTEKSIKTIRFNRPTKKNAFTPEMYTKITDEINQASKDANIKAIILTGTGQCIDIKFDRSIDRF